MKLFATWEVEKSSSNCIPRLCTLTLTRLVVQKPLESELQSVIIAVKMQSSKRVLRSNEIMMPHNSLIDTELELSFSLQYPHFLKQDRNKLQVMLQRRKKYKNRTILGYKTLAIGQVNMTQVLQRSVDRELSLYSDPKERTNVVALVAMVALSSQPVDHEENGRQKVIRHGPDRSPDIEISEEDEVHDDQDYSSQEELSDSEPNVDPHRSHRKFPRRSVQPTFSAGQRNIKQKFIALLRKFKVTDEVLDSEQDQDTGEQDEVNNPHDIEDLFDELDDLSESDIEMDTMSVLSTPKPKLRPFFTGRGGSTEILDINFKDSASRLSDDSNRPCESDGHVDYMMEAQVQESISNGVGHKRNNDPLPTGEVTSDHVGSSPSTPRSPTPKTKHQARVSTEQPSSKTTGNKATAETSSGGGKGLAVKEGRGGDRRGSGGNWTAAASDSVVSEMEPRRVLLDQLATMLSSEDQLPDTLILVNSSEWQGQMLAQALSDSLKYVISTCSAADVKATISFIVNKIQKFCNSNSRAPLPIKLALIGGDAYVNSVLRPYVEQFSSKSPDWQTYIKFLVIPVGSNSLGRYLSKIDCKYNSCFNDSIWKDAMDKSDSPSRQGDMGELVSRITTYVHSAANLIQLPVAEAMLTYKEKSTNEESSQVFVPFINEVRIGPIDTGLGGLSSTSTSMDLEEGPLLQASSILSSSPPQSCPVEKARSDNHTPPSSPNVNQPLPSLISHATASTSATTPPGLSIPPEVVDLQLDYWSLPMASSKTDTTDRSEKLQKKDSKSSLKTTFRSVQVFRLPGQQMGQAPPGDLSSATLSMLVVTKEKKQKIMRIGKKSKDSESKSQLMEGISRLICTSKTQTHPLTVWIDGTPWVGVKFFQLSAQWQTHIKNFPLLMFNHNLNESLT